MLKKAVAEDGVWFVRGHVELTKGDVLSALMLSQIAYWYSPSKNGKTKLRVVKKGHYWLAKSAKHWHEELGFTKKQSYRAQQVLRDLGLIETATMKFDGSPTVHIRLTGAGFDKLKLHSSKYLEPPKQNAFPLQGKSLTNTTPYQTTKPTACTGGGGIPVGGFKVKTVLEEKHVATPEEVAELLAFFEKKATS